MTPELQSAVAMRRVPTMFAFMGMVGLNFAGRRALAHRLGTNYSRLALSHDDEEPSIL